MISNESLVDTVYNQIKVKNQLLPFIDRERVNLLLLSKYKDLTDEEILEYRRKCSVVYTYLEIIKERENRDIRLHKEDCPIGKLSNTFYNFISQNTPQGGKRAFKFSLIRCFC